MKRSLALGLSVVAAFAIALQPVTTSYSTASSANAVGSSETIDLANLHIVESLDAVGRCLFRNGVFPSGGVGYEDSSLPYDDLGSDARALNTYRAELIRAFPNQLAGVVPSNIDNGVPEQVIAYVQAGSSLASRLTPLEPTLRSQELIESIDSQALLEAAAVLASNSELLVNATASSNLLDACEVQASIFEGDALIAAGIHDSVGVLSSIDVETGELVLQLPPDSVEALDRALAAHAGAYRVVALDAEISFQGRRDS